MGDVKWTSEQIQAIEEKGNNILVAAAAGSGKTAVLVERMINKVLTQNVDIDKILVVTFTNAAASEMRGRILEAIYKKLEENPNNMNLQRQMLLLNKASICTIDAFCLDVLKNNFFEMDISPNMKVGEVEEIEILKQEVLEELFEEKYEEKQEGFLKLISRYSTYTDDTELKSMIFKIYNFIQSNPFPNEWLEQNVEDFKIEKKEDFKKTKWGKNIVTYIKDQIEIATQLLKIALEEVGETEELEKYVETLNIDIQKILNIKVENSTWDEIYDRLCFKFDNWPLKRKFDAESSKQKKDEAKIIRDKAKGIIENIKSKVVAKQEQIYKEMDGIYEELNNLKEIILEFDQKYMQRKREKNIIEFNDIEHFALQLLLKKNKDGKLEKTEVAKKYMKKFEEIAIDEYQDSNLVQEYILTSISRENNIFMVGDVKQSIYKFRQARPELFLEKYKEYKLKKDKGETDNLKIQLFKNFRSRKNILDLTNFIFENIMSEKLGEIEYNKEEYLNLGADYKEPNEKIDYAGKTELYVITEKEEIIEENNEEPIEKEKNEEPIEIDDELEYLRDIELEAKFVAKKIQELVQSEYQVYDRKNEIYRKVTYRDIVVLLRSTKGIATEYEKEIMNLNMPVFSEEESQYLDTIEIQTIMNVLKIIDNPMQDIPLVSILRSTIGGFSDDELTTIRLIDRNENCYYKVFQKAVDNVQEKLSKKITIFLEQLKKWKEEEKYMELDQLIWKIYLDTGYYNYVSLMQNGEQRQANLKLLFEKAKQYEKASFKGLSNFIRFINNLQNKKNNKDMSPAKVIGQNDNVIRIMTIHKSKGLEFPVVFLTLSGKQFYAGDVREKLKIHQELGFGPVYLDEENETEWNSIQRDIINFKINEEMIAEEMRLFYVALTRVKEKLIITGVSKNKEKKEDDLKKEIELNKVLNSLEDNNKLSREIIKNCKSYLDWLIELYKNRKEEIKDLIVIEELSKEQVKEYIRTERKEEEDIFEKIKKMQIIKNQNIEEELKWKYKNQISTIIPTKTSVTKIKEMKRQAINEVDKINTENLELEIPQFLVEKKKISNAKKGTLMHLIIQKLDEKIDYTKQNILDLIKELVEKEIVLEEEAKAIDVEKVFTYIKSKFYQEVKKARLIKKEEPFYINIPAKEIYGEGIEENILVQGIIDLYYEDTQKKLKLVDYKTDYYKNEEELISKYKSQLQIYKIALEKSLKRKVEKVSIYSLYSMKEIVLDF